MTAASEQTPDIDSGIVRDLLLLAGSQVSLEAVTAWTPLQRAVAAGWAGAEHLNASDNPFPRRPKPNFVTAAEARP